MSEAQIRPIEEKKEDNLHVNTFQGLNHHAIHTSDSHPGKLSADGVVPISQPINLAPVPETKKRGPGRPRTRPQKVPIERHVMTQARLDALTKAREIRLKRIKERRILEQAEKEREKAFADIGRQVVKNAVNVSGEQPNNLAIEIGKVHAGIGEMIQPLIPRCTSSF